MTNCAAGNLPPLFYWREYYFPADDRHNAARFQNLRLGDFHDVAREDGEVGQHADVDLAFVFFLEGSVGGPEREHFQRLLA